MDQNLLLDRTALATKLGVSPSTIQKLVKVGAIPRPWHGRFFYWPHVVRAIEQSSLPLIDQEEESSHLPLPRILRSPAP